VSFSSYQLFTSILIKALSYLFFIPIRNGEKTRSENKETIRYNAQEGRWKRTERRKKRINRTKGRTSGIASFSNESLILLFWV